MNYIEIHTDRIDACKEFYDYDLQRARRLQNEEMLVCLLSRVLTEHSTQAQEVTQYEEVRQFVQETCNVALSEPTSPHHKVMSEITDYMDNL